MRLKKDVIPGEDPGSMDSRLELGMTYLVVDIFILKKSLAVIGDNTILV